MLIISFINFIDVDPSNPGQSTYNCRICLKAKEFKLRKDMVPEQSNENGVVLKNRKHDNSMIIKNHHEKPAHMIIIRDIALMP